MTQKAILQVCDSRSYKSKEPPEPVGSSPHREASPMPGAKEAGPGKDAMEEEAAGERGSTEAAQSRTGRSTRRGEVSVPGELSDCPARVSPFISVSFSLTSGGNFP